MNTRADQNAGPKASPKLPRPEPASIVTAQAGPSSQESAACAISPAMPDSSLAVATAAFVEPERRRAMIAEAAYYLAEHRGFEPGHQLEDWCVAECEIDARLMRGEIPAVCAVSDLI